MVYHRLRDEILSGQISPGELLSEAEVARRFDVSRTPVREALNLLASDRLVQALPQRGHLVRTISLAEIMEAFDLRELLEVKAAGEAALNITDEEVAELRKIIDDQEDGVLSNYVFHSKIAHISGNRLLAEFIDELLILMQTLIIDHPRLQDLGPEYQIIDALASHNPEAAREAMRTHTREARDSLMNLNRR